jgi:NET1-associated nuclear protein 1 (U3 small nucleolar RNA-associated protein 17)
MLLISHDSKYLFNNIGSSLNVYSIGSGELVYRLAYTDQQEILISSICINPLNKYQLLSFHPNGKICMWDYEDGLMLKTLDTNLHIKRHLVIKSSLYVIGNLKTFLNKTENHFSLYKLQLNASCLSKSSQMSIEHQLVLSNLNLNIDKFHVGIDYDEKYIAYLEGCKRLIVNQFKSNSHLKRFNAKMELTCIAMHPSEDCIATGTSSGKIILWYNYLQTTSTSPVGVITNGTNDENNNNNGFAAKPTMSILHWHALSVLSLCFTNEGSFLLSGGHECVLVKWMFKTGQKDFKPRLGAPLSEIACSQDNTIMATRHSDNSIHLIGSNLSIMQTFSTFICPNFSSCIQSNAENALTFYPCGLTQFSSLNCLITNGRPGHLQFYSFNSDKLLFNLDIVDENYISPENLNRPNIHTEIECLALSANSNWLATVERRNDLINTPETRLKFWLYDSASTKFALNTLVRYPHSFAKVTHLTFKGKENLLFSCGQDGCFKSWILSENKPVASQETHSQVTFNWRYNTCNGYRDLSPTHIEFAAANEDLMAVSFGHIATLWS